jgi:hypothetical protein
MNGKMRNLVGAAYYVTFILVVYIFGNMTGVDILDSMQRALSSAILFVQHLIGWLSSSLDIGAWLLFPTWPVGRSLFFSAPSDRPVHCLNLFSC